MSVSTPDLLIHNLVFSLSRPMNLPQSLLRPSLRQTWAKIQIQVSSIPTEHVWLVSKINYIHINLKCWCEILYCVHVASNFSWTDHSYRDVTPYTCGSEVEILFGSPLQAQWLPPLFVAIPTADRTQDALVTAFKVEMTLRRSSRFPETPSKPLPLWSTTSFCQLRTLCTSWWSPPVMIRWLILPKLVPLPCWCESLRSMTTIRCSHPIPILHRFVFIGLSLLDWLNMKFWSFSDVPYEPIPSKTREIKFRQNYTHE